MKILYIDMDSVLVDFMSGVTQFDAETVKQYENRLDEIPHVFSKMIPIENALEAYNVLAKEFDTYILSTAPWENPTAWHDKVQWVQKYLGKTAHKRLILSHNKHLNRGDFLIDDRGANGSDRFQGEWIQFGAVPFSTWEEVLSHLLPLK